MINNLDVYSLAIKLANAEKEDEVKQILHNNDLMDDSLWRPFGDNENNFSVIGAQQSSPDAALVEKLINSVDAVLIRRSLENNIDPEGPQAPKNIPEALQSFFDIKEGKLSNLPNQTRTEIARNIQLLATGRKTAPNYCIVDRGEGQTPNQLPNTILSLSKSNKLRVPFVQGKFNMGGTGVLQFCGKENYQLIISKRCPTIPDRFNQFEGKLDSSKDDWGVTIVRRNKPQRGAKSSLYEYLAPNNNILRFNADSLAIFSKDDFKWGTFIKLYNYEIGGLKTTATLNLYYALSTLMPSVALPIRIIETRDYKGHSLETTLSGLNVRLQEDKSKNLEKGFPYESELSVDNQKIKYSINVFKEGKEANYRSRNEGVILVVNGQTHGYLPKTIYERKKVGLGYIANSIITILDCSNLDLRSREDLFMNSRDKLRNGELKKKLEDNLEDLFHNDPVLLKLQKERRKKALQDRLNDEKPMSETLSKLLQTNPTLKNLLLGGGEISNPYDRDEPKDKSNDSFVGLPYPTYFEMRAFDEPKIVPINYRARITFHTDGENNYFGRSQNPGTIRLTVNGQLVSDYSVNLKNGKATINIKLPSKCKVGDKLDYRMEVTDPTQNNPFRSEFEVLVGIRVKNSGGKSTEKHKNKLLAPPHIQEIKKDQWEQFHMQKNGALRVIEADQGIYDFFVNIENEHLLSYLSSLKEEEVDLVKSQYKLGIALIGMAALQHYLDHDSLEEAGETEEEKNISQLVYDTTSVVSPILLPMLKSIGEIEI